jgi:hypothetical protein
VCDITQGYQSLIPNAVTPLLRLKILLQPCLVLHHKRANVIFMTSSNGTFISDIFCKTSSETNKQQQQQLLAFATLGDTRQIMPIFLFP